MSEDMELDAIRQALYANVRTGRMEVFLDEDGVEQFRMTEKGKRDVEAMIASRAAISPPEPREPK